MRGCFFCFQVSVGVGVFMGAAGACAPALAEEPIEAYELVVSATRTQVPRDQIGSSVTVISRDEIEKSHATQVIDLLRRTPGLSFNRNGGPGSVTDVRIRGTQPGQAKVLIDGVEVNDPTGIGNAFNFGGLQVTDIEQIEVLRGPQSALYGNDAMGGVINIITRRGAGDLRASLSVEGGSFGTHREAASLSGGWGGAGESGGDYALSVTHFSTDGFSRTLAGEEDDGTENTSVTARFGVDVSDAFRVNLSGGWSFLDTDFDPGSTVDGPAFQEAHRSHGALELIYLAFDGKLENILRFSGSRTQREFDEPLGFFRFSGFDGDRYGVEYRGNYSFTQGDIVTLGVERDYEEARNVNTTGGGAFSVSIDDTVRTDSVFGQFQFSPLTNLYLTVGARRDDNDRFGAETTYRGTAAYRVGETGTLLRASYGTAAKAPSLFQLFAGFFGNPNLRVETSDGFDAGVEQDLWDGRATATVTYFDNDFEDLIEFDLGLSTYRNIGQARTWGVENTLSVSVTPDVDVTASYTYQRAEDEVRNLELVRVPLHEANVFIDWDFMTGADAGLNVAYVGGQKDSLSVNRTIATRVVVDLNASYDLTENVTLFGRVENLLNRDYNETARFRAAGRSGYAGVRVGF